MRADYALVFVFVISMNVGPISCYYVLVMLSGTLFVVVLVLPFVRLNLVCARLKLWKLPAGALFVLLILFILVHWNFFPKSDEDSFFSLFLSFPFLLFYPIFHFSFHFRNWLLLMVGHWAVRAHLPLPLYTHVPLWAWLKITTCTALAVFYLSSSPPHAGPTSRSWRSWMRTLAGDLSIVWSLSLVKISKTFGARTMQAVWNIIFTFWGFLTTVCASSSFQEYHPFLTTSN